MIQYTLENMKPERVVLGSDCAYVDVSNSDLGLLDG